MFMGEYQHTLDAKGRMRIPVKFKEELGDKFVVTRGTGKCLFVFAPDEWQAFAQKLKSLPLTDKSIQMFVRLFFAGASEVEVDAQGRILLPANLREHAGLEKDVRVIGADSRVEIWSEKNWNELNALASDEYEDILAHMAQYGI